MNEPLFYADIADQLALIAQHLRERPLSADTASSEKAVDALVCARAVISELSTMAKRQDAEIDTTAPAP